MEQLTKNQAVATSQEAVQNQNEPQLRDENAHNDKSVHGVLNPTYQAGLRRDAVQDRKSGSAGMPRPISYAVFCLKKKKLGLVGVGSWKYFVLARGAARIRTSHNLSAPSHG